jgi:hypothetical protein
MYLKATMDWRSPSNDKVYREGQRYDVTDGRAAELISESAGALIPIDATVEVTAVEVILGAMSTETETAITAPDRRARGGRRRK